MTGTSDASEGNGADAPGRRLGDVVDRLERDRGAAERMRREATEGVLLDRLDAAEERLLSFGRALGGDPETVADLPFTEAAGTAGMPAALYVRHDPELLNQVASWLLQDGHVGVISPPGTGKTAFREIARRELGRREDFAVAAVDNAREKTPRALYEAVLRAARAAGYEIDPDDYWQVRDGIPWATDETKRAVRSVAADARADGATVLMLVDELEDLPEDLLTPLQVIADAGVRLVLTGTPAGKDRLEDCKGTLDSRLRYYEGIASFDPEDVAEYVARSLAHFRGEDYDGQSPSLFTPAAIRDVHERTGGTPREVRLSCRDLFARAAFVWHRTGTDADRISITPELRERRFGMGR